MNSRSFKPGLFAHELKILLAGHKNIEVSTALSISEPTVSQWVNAKDLCSVPHLADIILKFGPTAAAERKHIFQKLLLLREQELAMRGNEKWTAATAEFASSSINEAMDILNQWHQPVKTSGRTLCDFPKAFFPLAVICGDKRENSDSRITPGDFGAVTASPAELRWLSRLGLGDVEVFSDKIFLLENIDWMRERFRRKNLLVIGSPANNHLTRRLHLAKPPHNWRPGAPIFRFNSRQKVLGHIEHFLSTLTGLSRGELVGRQADPNTAGQMKFWLHHLFTGGVIDPTYLGRWKRGFDLSPGCDFGLLSFARNPFADSDQYVCILAAGFHLFGTAHAIGYLGQKDLLKSHPYGGVLRIDIHIDQPSFTARFDNSSPAWDTNSASYNVETLTDGLSALRNSLSDDIEVSKEELADSIELLKAL